jgi:hypothetical protein
MATQFDKAKTVKQINDELRLRILERLVALGLAVVDLYIPLVMSVFSLKGNS